MLSIVVPVFNGAENLEPLVRRIQSAISSLNGGIEIIFIDDCSTDGSLSEMKRLTGATPIIGWISLKLNSGQQAAVLCGLRHSRGDYVITMDDDLEHPPELIPELYLKAAGGEDAVYAVADIPGRSGGSLRDLFFTIFLKKPAGLRIGSYRIFSRRAVDRIITARQSFVYISAELFRNGFKAASISYSRPESRSGATPSRYSFISRLRLYFKLLYSYSPFSRRKPGIQYEIAAKGGCL